MITINRTPTQIAIASPYSPDLPARARQLSGRWDRDAGRWIFPAAAEPQVADLYRDVYGEWDTPTETVSLRCECGDGAEVTCESLCLGGRVIARAVGRDSGARTAAGVIVIAGGFRSGGSVKNWETVCRSGTIFRLIDVPVAKAAALVAAPEWCDSIEIEAADNGTAPDREALIEERTRISARLAEIDALLHQ